MISIKYFHMPINHLIKHQRLATLFSQGTYRAEVFTPVRFSFFESGRKGGRQYELHEVEMDPMKVIPQGWSALKTESKLWLEEVKEKFRQDPKWFKHGDTDVVFRFDSEENIKKWKTASDSNHKEGFSHCQLEQNNHGKAVFSGIIDTTVPKDGKIKSTGYCAMKSKEKMRSFFRMDAYDWLPFTHLEMRVRGDGRNYVIGLSTSAYYDVNWLDLYTYSLHTRGGPYWQTTKIPFSKFFLTNKGYIQDKQFPFKKDMINSIIIICARVPGPFRLEIDYIGVHKDDLNFEKFAYELYRYPKDMVSS